MKKIKFPFFTPTTQRYKALAALLRSKHFLISIMLAITLIICLCIIPSSSNILKATSSINFLSKDNLIQKSSSSHTLIIDAGHGGTDPGKVSSSGTMEKNINLQIALYLKEMLEAQNINVIMTREDDKELTTNEANRKISDMKERLKLAEESNANLVISIHQNSYSDPNVYGAQCFYHTNSTKGKELAAMIQNQIITSTNQTKIRSIKDNNDYYLLKHSPIPTVIVECGFLSNPDEEQLLLTQKYQRQLAWAIHLGILQYLNQ